MSVFKQVQEMDELIRQLHKMESKLRSGQIIDAWRELNRILALLTKERESLIKQASGDADVE